MHALAGHNKFRPVWSPDGARLATFGEKTVIWDIVGGLKLASFDIAAPAEWSPDGKRLAYTFGNGERFEIRDAQSGLLLVELANPEPVVAPGARLAWSPDAARVAGFGRVWNAATGEAAVVLERFGKQANPGQIPGQPAWSPDGAFLAYEMADRTIGVADATTGKIVATLLSFTRGRTLAVSPSGHLCASPRAEDELVYVVETDAGQELLSPQEFADKYHWRNEPSRLGLKSLRNEGPSDETDASPELADALPALGPLALVQRPAPLAGVESWSLEPVEPIGNFQLNKSNSMGLSPDGKWFALGGDDGHVRVFDWASGSSPRLARLLVGHASPVIGVAFSPDGRRIATAEIARPLVRVWDFESAKTTCTATVGLNTVTCLSWSPDSRIIAVNGIGGPRLVDAHSGEMLPLLEGDNRAFDSIAFSPDGRQLAAGGFIHGPTQIWDVETGMLQHTFEAAGSVAWSPDGTRLASAGSAGTRVWDGANGALLHTLAARFSPGPAAAAPFWLEDSATLRIYDDAQQRSQLWDVATGKPVGEAEVGHRLRRAQSADGQTAAIGGIWGEPTSLHDLRSRKRRQITLRTPIICAAWAPKGRALAANVAERLWLWEPERTTQLVSLATPDGIPWYPWQLAWLNDGDGLLDARAHYTGIYSRSPQGWTSRTVDAAPHGTAAGPAAALSRDGSRLAFAPRDTQGRGAEDARIVVLCELSGGKRLGELESHPRQVSLLAWSPDDRRIAGVNAFEVETSTLAMWDVESRRLIKTADFPKASGLSWSPDGKNLALACWDGRVRLCDEELRVQMELAGHLGNPPLTAVAWSPDGSEIITVDGSSVRRWTTATGELRSRVQLDQPRQVLKYGLDSNYVGPSFQFSPDNRLVAALGAALKVFDTETGRQQLALAPLREGRAVAISADGHFQGTPGAEKDLVYVVQTADGQELLSPAEFAAKHGWKNDPQRVALPAGGKESSD